MKIKNNIISDSLEDYLETIFELETSNKVARAKDIAEKRGVLQGSVTGALRALADKGLINYKPYSFITLTDKGELIAKEITRRHAVISNFLQNVLLMSSEKAEANACRMEHAMDRSAVDRLVQFIEYIDDCPRTDTEWIDGFVRFYSKKNRQGKDCEACLQKSINDYLKSD